VVTLIAADEFVFARMAALFPVLAHELERGLHRFGTPAEGFDEIERAGGHLPHALDEIKGHIGCPVHGRGKAKFFQLLVQGFDHAGVTVSQRADEDAADAIEVALALHVPVIQTLGPGDNERIVEESRGGLIVEERAFQQTPVAIGKRHGDLPLVVRSGWSSLNDPKVDPVAIGRYEPIPLSSSSSMPPRTRAGAS